MPSDSANEDAAEDVLTALGDELSRQILVEGASGVVTASSLAEAHDVSPTTVYRRLNRLEALGLIDEVSDVRADLSSETGYRSSLEALAVVFSAAGFSTTTAESDIEVALAIFLDHVDVTEVTFDFENGTVLTTLSMDDETLDDLHDSYRKLQRQRGRRLETDNR